MISVLRRKQAVSRVGRSPGLWGSEGKRLSEGRFTFPGSREPSGLRSDTPALTVAEPRRTCTGLPCYARRGHPRRAEVVSPDAAIGQSRIARQKVIFRRSASPRG